MNCRLMGRFFKGNNSPWIFALMMFLLSSASVHGASLCIDCHNMPPIDAAYRNISTGGFMGNHQTHNPSPAGPGSCEPCHTGSTVYTSGHANGVINLSANVNSSPATGAYSKGVFFNQTSVPVMGNCSNVNCHFEAVTPNWSSAALVSPAGCGACHGSPPSDGNHPAIVGPGKKHGDYYGTGTTSCLKCHTDHTTDANPFSHALSAGSRGIILQFNASPNSGGVYSKTANLAYPAYLPSQTTAANRNGTCSSLYCHSDGNGGAPNNVPTWGGTLPTDCTGCHGGNATTAKVIASGSHTQHVNNIGALGTNFKCANCHSVTVGTGSDQAITGLTSHVTGTKAISISGGGNYTVGTKTCSTTTCHGAGAPVWGTSTSKTSCEKCHGSAATVPFVATSGNNVPTDPKVGAHTNHLNASTSGHKYDSNIACSECHTVPAADNVAGHFDISGPAPLTFGTLAKTGGLSPSYNPANGQCSNTYCHGNSLDMPASANLTPTWNVPFLTGVASNDCVKCHGYPPATLVHSGQGPTNCTTCHPHVNSTGTGFIDPTKHINGTIDASGGHSVPYYGHNIASLVNCAGCHNTSQAGPYPAAVAGTAPNCRGCHLLADPTVVSTSCTSCHAVPPNGTTHPNIAGTHVKHSALVGTPNTCTVCHIGAGSGSGVNHGPGNRGANPAVDNINFSGVAGTSAAWTAASKTCSATYCHGANAPVWGTTLPTDCTGCHGGTSNSSAPIGTNAHGTHLTRPYGPGNYLGGSISSCQTCHNYSSVQPNPLHANGVVDLVNGAGSACVNCHAGTIPTWNVATRLACTLCHAASPAVLPNGVAAPYKGSFTTTGHGQFAASNQCTACHDQNSAHIAGSLGVNMRLFTADDNSQCATCHNNSTARVMSTHVNDKNATPTPDLCKACHDVHGTANLHMIRTAINGITVTFTNMSSGFVMTTAPYNGLCQVCHTLTNHYRSGVAETGHPNKNCLTCHSHTGTYAFQPSSACDSCHGYPPAPAGFAGTHGNYSSARSEDYLGGSGAHLVAAHVNPNAKPSDGWANCTKCHGNGSLNPTTHTMQAPVTPSKITIDVDNRYRFNPNLPLGPGQYSGVLLDGGANATGSCFNVSCHFKPSKKWSTVR